MMTPRAYFEHCKQRSFETLADNPRPIFGGLALASTLAIIFLAWPGEILGQPGYVTVAAWHINDEIAIALFAVHLWGMLRAIFQLVSRPKLDVWILRLGVVLFGLPPITVMLDLHRPTLLGATGLAFGLLSVWALVYRGRLPSAPQRRRDDALP